ncbi:uncharacterized protein LOC115361783 isoform X2 [Myripristis murdjan]|uniref:uncharacterized protein LOC115361783 isoform X2 n=1 Tax=Myripristis murdjan TaxID=586833 RepID=UPI00117626AC|nr:uncharacterized protein LOC115361783 isoform X2 [Myripristis murdjan]
MGSLGVASNRFMDHASKTVSIIVIVSYHVVLHLDLPCSCKPGMNQCNVYMVVPFFIIFFVILWTDISCQTTLRYTCKNFRCKFCCVLLKNTLKAVCIGLLWVVSVLIDGDWFVCCENDQSPKQIVLACKVKNKSNLTSEEQEIITELKGKSLERGLYVLLGICILGVFGGGLYSCLSSCCKRMDCCSRCCKSLCGCCSCCFNTQHEVNELILEEWENQLKDGVKKATDRTLTNKLKEDKKTGKCFDYVDEISKDPKLLLLAKPQEKEVETKKEEKQGGKREEGKEGEGEEEEQHKQQDDDGKSQPSALQQTSGQRPAEPAARHEAAGDPHQQARSSLGQHPSKSLQTNQIGLGLSNPRRRDSSPGEDIDLLEKEERT